MEAYNTSNVNVALNKPSSNDIEKLNNIEKQVKNSLCGMAFSLLSLYNILLTGEGKMVVNGMIVETLSPSNNIARLYKMLEGYKEEEKREIIKIYNEERKECKGKKQMK